MKAIVDRFEGEFAVLTPVGGSRPFNLAKAVLPAGTAEGDTVELSHGSWTVRGDETDDRRKRIMEKARRLFNE